MSGTAASPSQDARECLREAPMSPQASLTGLGEPPLAAVMTSLAADQALLLAPIEDLAQELLSGGLVTQGQWPAPSSESLANRLCQRTSRGEPVICGSSRPGRG